MKAKINATSVLAPDEQLIEKQSKNNSTEDSVVETQPTLAALCVSTTEAATTVKSNVKAADKGKAQYRRKVTTKRGSQYEAQSEFNLEMTLSPSTSQPSLKSKAQIRREVFARANSQCENCGSSHALEIDHIKPQALGGPSTPDNLRLLCR